MSAAVAVAGRCGRCCWRVWAFASDVGVDEADALTDESRSVGRARVLWGRLRGAPLRVLAGLGRVTGVSARADRAISRACVGCLFKSVSEVRRCEVAIVPGAYVFPDGTPSDMLADRLGAALALLEAGKVGRVLVSGGPDEVAGMQAWMARHGVMEVLADPAGLRTWATMTGVAALGVARAVVCTQRFHLSRAVFLARAAGIDAVGLIADTGHDRGGGFNRSREACARVRALFDVWWSGRGLGRDARRAPPLRR